MFQRDPKREAKTHLEVRIGTPRTSQSSILVRIGGTCSKVFENTPPQNEWNFGHPEVTSFASEMMDLFRPVHAVWAKPQSHAKTMSTEKNTRSHIERDIACLSNWGSIYLLFVWAMSHVLQFHGVG